MIVYSFTFIDNDYYSTRLSDSEVEKRITDSAYRWEPYEDIINDSFYNLKLNNYE